MGLEEVAMGDDKVLGGVAAVALGVAEATAALERPVERTVEAVKEEEQDISLVGHQAVGNTAAQLVKGAWALAMKVPLEVELATGEGGMALAVMEMVAETPADKVGGRRATATAAKVAVATEVETLAMARKGGRTAGASVAARVAAMGKVAAAEGEVAEQAVALLAAVAEISEDGLVGCMAAAVVTWERVELEDEAAETVV
ncbi:hypothetical protein AB1Y20_004559 [Prymnesium parvum]|uniref:Uncharacterized protein n=1 Tax=Prymnesium parvum TaxID=97485 RepID=A0AB34IWT4_PRYPA